jgi:hypothetical protein
MPDSEKAINVINECVGTLDAIHGLYLDATYGMGTLAKQASDRQATLVAEALTSGSTLSLEDLNPLIAYLSGPSEARTVIHHVPTNQYVTRNVPGGINWHLLAQYCLVALFQFWEKRYRPEIAEALGMALNDVRIDSFGELRHFRRGIVHNKGRATPAMAANLLLPSFAEGSDIDLSAAEVHTIFDRLKRDLLLYAETLRPAA